jgi:hypothetical protein
MSWFDYHDPNYSNEMNSYLFKHQKRQEKKHTSKSLVCKCPVCKSTLGRKNDDSVETFHCADCKANYTFYAGVKLPSGQPDRYTPKSCNCPACRARYLGGKEEPDPEPPEDLDHMEIP